MFAANSSDLEALLLPTRVEQLVAAWLLEDCPGFDVGGAVVGDAESQAHLLAKSPGRLAGRPFFNEVFRQLGCSVTWHRPEGYTVPPDVRREHIATVRGPTRKLLLGERVALNTLARCSGIATKSAQLLEFVRRAGYANILSGTRKTTPGFRLVEKYGMLVGGCDTHRMDLSSMTMLKDNHIVASGSVTKAVKTAKAAGGFALKVEVECQSEEQANEAIQAGADVVMLDNFAGDEVRVTAARLKQAWQGQRYFLIEVSGGLTQSNIEAFACPEVDIISTSSIHQGVPHVDFSLKIVAGPSSS